MNCLAVPTVNGLGVFKNHERGNIMNSPDVAKSDFDAIVMLGHVCEESTTCECYMLADEPNEDCPVHGHPWPPRCGTCGRFMPWDCRIARSA